MKKTTILITALIMLFVSAPQAKAVQMYYTFEGIVDNSSDDAGYILSQLPSALIVGSPVTYTLILDFAAPGFVTDNDGNPTISGDTGNYDYFYADAYSGDYLVSTDGGLYNAGSSIAEYNLGSDNLGSGGSTIYVNSEDELLNMYSPSSKFSDLTVGALLLAYNQAYKADTSVSIIYSSLKLMSITPVSVPEPSILLLLGSGLLGLGMFRRMRQEG